MSDVVRDGDDMRIKELLQSMDHPMGHAVRERTRELGRRHFGDQPTDALLEEGRILGSWQIDRVLGAGGQAVVYLAKHIRLSGRLAAVKVPHGAETRRMVREAHVLARLDHPGILGVLDLDADGDTPYVVVDHCVGGSLADRIESEGPLPEAEVVSLSLAILDALGYAHSRSVVHRDLKPENILFDGTGHLRIADFGIGRVVADQISLSFSQGSATGVAGTPVYMAPEQERPGGKLDGRVDLYAMGKIIYHMLTGQVPRTLRPVERERKDVAAGWSDLVFRLTATDPAERFQEASSVAEAIERLGVGGEVRTVEPPTESEADVEETPRTRSAWYTILANVAFAIAFFAALGGALAYIWSEPLWASTGRTTAFFFGFLWFLFACQIDQKKKADQDEDEKDA